MFAVLQSIGFASLFVQALGSLYSCPTATVRLLNAISQPIDIKNGTHQGCPLSPMLFVLGIELLAAAIHLNNDITGVQVHNREYNISLCR